MGVEPTDAFTSPVFKTGAFDHSATSPCVKALNPNADMIVSYYSVFVNRKKKQKKRKKSKLGVAKWNNLCYYYQADLSGK